VCGDGGPPACLLDEAGVDADGPLTAVLRPAGGTRGVLLDVDDTLLGTREAMVLAGEVAARGLWPDAEDSRLSGAGQRFRDDPAGHFRAYTRGELEFAGMRAQRVADLASWLGQEPSAGDTDRWNELYEAAFARALRAFDDVLTALARCREQGLAVGLLTNSSADYTRVKLELAGLAGPLARLTAATVTKDTLGVGKPAPAVFHHACALMGLRPDQVVYVGDELDVDTCAALRAGLGAAWLRRPGYQRATTDVTHAASHGLVAAGTLGQVLDALA
jgi:putative hydrolase of the HAD superfamily